MTTTAPMTDEELARVDEIIAGITDMQNDGGWPSDVVVRLRERLRLAEAKLEMGWSDQERELTEELAAERHRNKLASAIEREVIMRLSKELAAERAKVAELEALPNPYLKVSIPQP